MSALLMAVATTSGPTLSDVEAVSQKVFVAETQYLYTDAGSTNVTTDGDSVQEWHSTDGGLVLSLVGSGLTYNTDGTHEWVTGTGSGRLQGTTPAGWTGDMFYAVAGRATENEQATVIGHADSAEPDENSRIAINPNGGFGGFNSRTGGGGDWSSMDDHLEDTDYVMVGYTDTSASASTYRRDGVAATDGTVAWDGTSGDAFTLLGLGDNSPLNQPCRVYAAVVEDSIPASADIDTIEQWLADQSGVTL